MKAAIIHTEIISQYFLNGEEVTLTADEKLLFSIFGTTEENPTVKKTTTFETLIAVVDYKNEKELNARFYEVADGFTGLIHPNDMKIIRQYKPGN